MAQRSTPKPPAAKKSAAKKPANLAAGKKPDAARAAPKKAAAAKAPAGAGTTPVRAAAKRAAPAQKPATARPGAAQPPVDAEPLPALPAGEQEARTLPFELDPRRLEEGLKSLQGELVHWANKGRYTRVRFKFRGKQLLPDLPLAAVVAAEGLTFYWGGILRALLFNVAGKSVLSVELVNDADKRVQAGKEALLSGDVDVALARFREALAMDRDHAAAHLQLGVCYRLQGQKELAISALEKARQKDPEGAVGAEAERLLTGLRGGAPRAG